MVNMISIEGIDRAGKDTLFKHLQWLGDHYHVILNRGPLSNVVFSQMFGRGFNYKIEDYRNILFVFLDVDYDDWIVRCEATNEPSISFEKHYAAYEDAIKNFKKNGCIVVRYNTSKKSIHQIALDVLRKYDELNNEKPTS